MQSKKAAILTENYLENIDGLLNEVLIDISSEAKKGKYKTFSSRMSDFCKKELETLGYIVVEESKDRYYSISWEHEKTTK